LKVFAKKILGKATKYIKESDKDYQVAKKAQGVYSPSHDLAKIIEQEWNMPNIKVIPNLFTPDPGFIHIPEVSSSSNVVTFIGKLDVRKGIPIIIDAIPLVLKKYPEIRFKFIGKADLAPNGKDHMDDYLKRKLSKYLNNIELTGRVPLSDIPLHLADTAIILVPSIWENFPFVCLEGMAAGKAIIASNTGGMKEMLKPSNGGLLVDPTKPAELANAIITLWKDKRNIQAMGKRNRQYVLDYFASDILPEETEAYYKETINKITSRS
jgi:glycosyltransferase involved in cell wall biosynthesis